MTKYAVIKKSCDRDGYVVEWRNVTMMPLMGYFQIASVIYRIANNLICQASNIVVISHLKQFIGCSLTIIHEGHACFTNNQSNSNTSRLDNEKLLRGMRPIQAQWWNRTNLVLCGLPWTLHSSYFEGVCCECICHWQRDRVHLHESIS